MDLFKLSALLTMDSSQFEKGIDKAEKTGKNAASKMEKNFSRVKKAFAAIISVAAVKKGIDAMTSLANATAAAGDKIDKQSQALGMSRRAYQEWDYILSQSGASIDSMNVSMKTLNAAIVDGSKDSEEALKELGLTSQELGLLSQEQAFERVVRAFQQMPAGAQKSALAVKLFGRNGQELMALLNSGATSIDEMRIAARGLGLVMSDEAVDASVKYTDAMDTMKRTFAGLRYSIGSRLLPTFTGFINKVTSYTGKLKKAFDRNGFSGIFDTIRTDLRNIDWAGIGNGIKEKIKGAFLGGGALIKRFILGDAYTEDSSWADVGEKLRGSIEKAFSKGGMIDTLLGNATEKTTAMIGLAGEFVKGISNWVTTHTSDVVGIITGLVTAIGQSAEPIIQALTAILTDPSLWSAIGNALEAIVRAIFGDAVGDFLFGNKQKVQNFADAASVYHSIWQSGARTHDEIVGRVKGLFGDTDEAMQVVRKYEEIQRKLPDRGSAVGMSDEDAEKLLEYVRAAEEARDKLTEEPVEVTPELNIDTIQEQLNKRTYTVRAVPNVVDGETGFSQAKGDWYVPYDNYPSLLHRGERVLTASQARHSDNGKVDYIRIGEMIGTAVDSAMSRMGVYLGADRVGDLTSQRVGKNIRVNSNARLRAMGG